MQLASIATSSIQTGPRLRTECSCAFSVVESTGASVDWRWSITVCVNRAFGVHLSFVRSVTLDNWKDEHLATMICGGHARLRSYVAANPVLSELKGEKFYAHPLMVEYRRILFLDSRRRLGIDGQRILDDAEADRKKWERKSLAAPSGWSPSSAPQATRLAPIQKQPGCCGCF
jgi:hypothetical protein